MMIYLIKDCIIPKDEVNMSETFISGLNSIIPGLDSQNSKGIGGFDLNDDTFSNILDDKLDKNETEQIKAEDITNKLGVPAGLNIEGFDYNAMVNDINSTEMVEGINTENQINDNNKFNLGSLIEDAVDAFSPVVQSLANAELNLDSNSNSNPLNAVKDFWNNQASNFYNIMNKDTINNISELVSKL